MRGSGKLISATLLTLMFLTNHDFLTSARAETKLVPDQFLRRWDPVTFFLSGEVDVEPGAIETNPENYVVMTPEHPGEFIWIDARTLQFRPVDAWPPYMSFTFTLDNVPHKLHCLASPPVTTSPITATENLDPLDSITLTFPDPVNLEYLADMMHVALRPLPGLAAAQVRTLDKNDFELKSLPRKTRHEPMTVAVTFNDPIPSGVHVEVSLQLGDDTEFGHFVALTFSTAEPFRPIAFGSRTQRLPVTQDGSEYSKEQALNCGVDKPVFVVEFSSSLRPVTPIEGRNFIRISPDVANLEFTTEGKLLFLNGDFERDVMYHVTLAPSPLTDSMSRQLEMTAPSELYFFFPNQPAFVKWSQSQGIVERLGPKQIPIDGRGFDRVDLRIYKIDPLDISFWPFPDRPIEIDENESPPPPGEEPEPFQYRYYHINPWELGRQIRNLTSPNISIMADLPLQESDPASHAGLDLETLLADTFGQHEPGHYLIGIRTLDVSTTRSFIRVQSTDLCLTTVENNEDSVLFAVSSLSTARPIAGATIRVERFERDSREGDPIIQGTTDAEGLYRFRKASQPNCQIHRITVTKDSDVLVLDPNKTPDTYSAGNWTPTRETWLQWLCYTNYDQDEPLWVGHLFTERPVYRPEDVVHIKGYIRTRKEGRLEPYTGDVTLTIRSPGDSEWSQVISIREPGNFYHAFSESNLPTGLYQVDVTGAKDRLICSTSFRIDAYRIPRFEVSLHGPDIVPLDAPFDVKLTASYYAGGSVADRPAIWRVTQLPLDWKPKGFPGFIFSSHQQFIGRKNPDSWPRIDSEGTTDSSGAHLLSLNPAAEPSAEPRSYAIEATVRDVDEMTVTTARKISAIPPFAIGLKTGRYFEEPSDVTAQFIVLGLDEKPISGHRVHMRLIHRQWHSHLRASDFTDGVARYVTDVVDETIQEGTLKSDDEPKDLDMDFPSSGVYVLELEGTDRLGRAYVVRSDFYVGGTDPVAWSKPVTRVFDVSADQDSYDPGHTASIVLQSPFQNANALAILEAPEGNVYSWIQIRDGSGVFQVPIQKNYVPRIPVHFILMRGRLAGVLPQTGSVMDLGKPATMSATTYLTVNPVEHRLGVTLDYPKKAKPGETITIDIALTGPDNKPASGEITLWLVDQAVLSLGKERRLDPVPDFIRSVFSRLSMHDTRDMPFGYIPYSEMPGGGAAEDDSNLFDRLPIRKNFVAVPFYKPDIMAGKDGKAQVTVTLPDNLTNFAIRAKASSGSDRFGFATGMLAVRLPVIVQPSFPRFVRPGDQFNGLAIGRIVEGNGGDGLAQLKVLGATLSGDANHEFEWDAKTPTRIEFPLIVDTPPFRSDGTLEYDSMTVSVAVSRESDEAGDAFEVAIPIRDDRHRVSTASMTTMDASKPLTIPAVSETCRPGTLQRTLTVSSEPDILRMLAGLDFFFGYPYGCAEQRISFGRSMIAVKKLSEQLLHPSYRAKADVRVQEVIDFLPRLIDRNGLCAYWNGSDGSVFLTSLAVSFLAEARDAGYPIDTPTLNTFCRALEQSLRSDYTHLILGSEYIERAWALRALADAGKANPGFVAEMSRRAQYLGSEDVAQVIQAFVKSGTPNPETAPRLIEKMMAGFEFKMNQGTEIFSGMQADQERNGLIMPSAVRAAGETIRALYQVQPDNPKVQILVDGIIDLGKEDGWGSTNANAAAILSLCDAFSHRTGSNMTNESIDVTVTSTGQTTTLKLDQRVPASYYTSTSEQAIELRINQSRVGIREETSYIPSASGSTVEPMQAGFVVTRELLKLIGPDQPMERLALDAANTSVSIPQGTVIEDHVRIVNPEQRNYVAITVPLAAGMEPLNPELLTAPPEARPANTMTQKPDYAEYLDDRVAFYFNTLPAGSFDFYFRVKALIPGHYTQPPALAEMMYQSSVRGNSAGASIEITLQ